MKEFKFPWDSVIKITESGPTTLPTNTPIKVYDLLRGYVELSQPATRKDLAILIANTESEADKPALAALMEPGAFETQILNKRLSILDILKQHPTTALPFPTFLALLPPLRPRHYSISSSPLASPTTCTLTYSVIDAPSWSAGETRFLGVTGNYLRSLEEGDQALVGVRSTNKYFRLPTNPEQTPVVMVCAGSGVAPFRGFIQERATLIGGGGRKLAPALLFVGCRFPSRDRLYGPEFDEWVRLGAVDVRYAFSRQPQESEGCKYVQERILHDKMDIVKMWDAGATFYICGSRELAQGMSKAARELITEGAKAQGRDMSEEDIKQFVAKMRNERFVMDTF
jgi:cytochrome P450 / NADPH-cytochrome P450 reductase